MSKKVWTMEEYDEGTLDSFRSGFMQGVETGHGVASGIIQGMITSIDDVISLYENKFDVDIHLPMVKQALIRIMGEVDKSYADFADDYKAEIDD